MATDGNFGGAGTQGAVQGFYTYTYSFNGALGGNLSLTGSTGDNGIRSLIISQTGGPTLYSCVSNPPGGPTLCAATQNSVTPSTGTLNFSALAGRTITITAVVENLDGATPGARNPSGFIASGSAFVNDPTGVPEPSTYAMLGLGGLAMLVARRRK